MNSNDELSREEGTCAYDADGNRVQITTVETRNGYTFTVVRAYEYQDGNLIKFYLNPGTMSERLFEYEYYLDRENKSKSFSQYPYLTSATPSRHMVKKITGTSSEPGAASSVDQYSYEYNDQGFIVKDVHTYTFGSTSSTISRTYEYNCQ
jgi:ribosomal protein S24E